MRRGGRSSLRKTVGIRPPWRRTVDLTDGQWKRLALLLPKPRRRPDGRGRPWRDPRDGLHGVLWVMRTGAPWHDLPDRYPPYQTCHRRFQLWARNGTLARVLHRSEEHTSELQSLRHL